MIELEIISISEYNNSSSSFVLYLAEKNGTRALPIVVGSSEAYSIASIYQNAAPTRPLTHDLLKSCIEILGASLEKVVIRDLAEGVFYSSLFIEKEGSLMEIDSRTSDAVSLALRFHCPIFTTEKIMKEAGSANNAKSEVESLEEAMEAEVKPKQSSGLKDKSTPDLMQLMDDAISNENYELAARIRDELDKREES